MASNPCQETLKWIIKTNIGGGGFGGQMEAGTKWGGQGEGIVGPDGSWGQIGEPGVARWEWVPDGGQGQMQVGPDESRSEMGDEG